MYLERSFSVDTLGILIATAVVSQTFIDVTANSAVAGESLATSALVSALGIVTLGIDVTVERTQQTFVVVRAARAIVLNGITFLASTFERSQCVVTFSVEAHARRRTLVNIFASNSIGRRGQTALTGAQITAWRVGTFATVTEAWILFAFVNIGATSSVHQ